jgi:diguanylate cyclase (GGDEF)-like protein
LPFLGLVFTQTQPDHHIRLYEELSSLNNEFVNLQRELAKKNAELERLNIEIKRLAIQDELTKVYNRRGFFELGYRTVEQAKRSEKPLAAIMIDIDFFKKFNDNYGHAIGDIVLTEVARLCSQQLRSMDILGRCGGEEFFVLLPETELDNALIIAERLRYHVCNEPVATEPGLLTVTISLGLLSPIGIFPK